jgi:small subunit ribosomal protein S16
VAVKIRLKRMGKIRTPFYRVVVMDSRTKRDGRAIEEIGKYHPTEEPSLIDIDSDRAQYWLGNGAQPTEPVLALLKITGDWQKFKGEPGAEGTLKVKEPKKSKKELYEAALAAAGAKADAEDSSGATTARRKAAPKKAAKKAEETVQAPAEEAPATDEVAAVADEPAAEPTPADTDSGAASADGTNTDADSGAEAGTPAEDKA